MVSIFSLRALSRVFIGDDPLKDTSPTPPGEHAPSCLMTYALCLVMCITVDFFRVWVLFMTSRGLLRAFDADRTDTSDGQDTFAREALT